MELSLPFQHSYDETPEVPVAAINPQTARRFEFKAVVDTGADGTLLDSSIAQEIGIDLEDAPPALVGGIGGVLAGAKSGRSSLSCLAAQNCEPRSGFRSQLASPQTSAISSD